MNSPAEASWPDWHGETAIIVATGPSATDFDLAEAQGKARFIVIKSSWRLAPWADALYGCDRGWWLANAGAPWFHGLKITASPTVAKVYPEVRRIKLVARAEILTEEMARIGCGLRTGGGHSGFHAINLAVQFGAKRIILVGMDMIGHRHWHDAENFAIRRDEKQMRECREALDGCAPQLERLGIRVLNTSMDSALRNYPKVTVGEALAW
jgi:hypothetical protein